MPLPHVLVAYNDSAAATRHAFATHGYVVIRRLLPEAVIDGLAQIVAEYVRDRGPRLLPGAVTC